MGVTLGGIHPEASYSPAVTLDTKRVICFQKAVVGQPWGRRIYYKRRNRKEVVGSGSQLCPKRTRLDHVKDWGLRMILFLSTLFLLDPWWWQCHPHGVVGVLSALQLSVVALPMPWRSWPAPSFETGAGSQSPETCALWARSGSDISGDLWITFLILLPLSWRIVAGFSWADWSILISFSSGRLAAHLVFSFFFFFFLNMDRVKICQIFKFCFFFA